MTTIISTPQSTIAQADLSRPLVWGLLVAGLFTNLFGIVGGVWDGAYHARYIVDTFWSPPHLLIYSGIGGTLVIGLAILTLLLAKGREWNSMMLRNPLLFVTLLANLGFLATGPFDELWHALFGRDKLTVWTVPHIILNLNLALTALGVVGLAVWLRAARPSGSLTPAQAGSPIGAQNLAIFVGLSMVIIHGWGFLTELELGDTSLSPVPGIGWLYPLMAAVLVTLCLALASQLLPKHWWMAIPLVVLAQMWWVAPGIVLRQFGYEQVESIRVTLTLAGLIWALISWYGNKRPAWLRFAIFGVGFILIVVVARLFGRLPATSNSDVLLTGLCLPALAVLGGYAGMRLGAWLQRLAGDVSVTQG